MFERILEITDKPIRTLAQEFYEKVVRDEHPFILERIDHHALKLSILRNFISQAKALGYPLTGRKHDGQSPRIS